MTYYLAWNYIEGDIEGNIEKIVYTQTVDAAFAQFDESKKQVFILDDFWGSVRHRSSTDQRKLQMLISGVAASKNQRLIITTREYILEKEIEENRLCSDLLKEYSISCNHDSYTSKEQVYILFSHVKKAKLPWDYCYEIYRSLYDILEKTQFNPRMILMIIEQKNWEKMYPTEYAQELLWELKEPYEFWESLVNEQQEDTAVLLMILLSYGGKAYLSDLEKNYQVYVEMEQGIRKVRTFQECLSSVEKSVAISYVPEFGVDNVILAFKNPGIMECMYRLFHRDPDTYYKLIVNITEYFNQTLFFSGCWLDSVNNSVKESISQKCQELYEDGELLYVWDDDLYFDELHPEYEYEMYHFLIIERVFKRSGSTSLLQFLQEKLDRFIERMKNREVLEFWDLDCFPQVISECQDSGLRMDGYEILENYWYYMDHVLLYRNAEKWKEIFPEAYQTIMEKYGQDMETKVMERILLSLTYFDEHEDKYYWEKNYLIGQIPDILQRYRLSYTEEFQKQVMGCSGWTDIPTQISEVRGSQEEHDALKQRIVDRKLKNLEKSSKDVENWLAIDEMQKLSEQEIRQNIENSNLDPVWKSRLQEILEQRYPWYIYESLKEPFLEPLIFKMIDRHSSLVENAAIFFRLLLLQKTELSELGDVAVNMMMLARCFMYHQSSYMDGEEIQRVVESNDEVQLLRKWLKTTPFVRKSGEWVLPQSEMLCFFCLAFTSLVREETDKQELYQDLFDNSMNEIRVYEDGEDYLDYFDTIYSLNFQNKEWESIILKMFEEIDPESFNKFFLKVVIDKIAAKLEDGAETFIQSHMLETRGRKSKDHNRIAYKLDDGLLIIEQLGLGKLGDCLEKDGQVNKEAFKKWKQRLLEIKQQFDVGNYECIWKL